MLDEMPDELFQYWMAYASIKPFGQSDRLLAQLNALYYNVHRGDHPAARVEDFLPVRITPAAAAERKVDDALQKAMDRNKKNANHKPRIP